MAGRDIFSSCKAEDESGLTPGEDDNAAGRKKNRPDAAQRFQDRSIMQKLPEIVQEANYIASCTKTSLLISVSYLYNSKY